MHQAQPKEGHKIWLTQEADAKSWSSLKHVQPKEGLKELGIRYHNPRESRHFPRGAQESERYPGLFFFVSFFSLFLIRDVVGASLRAMDEAGVREAAPQSEKAIYGKGTTDVW